MSVMTTAASRKTHLDAIMIGRCQGDDTFVAFQLMGIFCFSLISKDLYSRLLSSQVFHFALVSSSSLVILSVLATIK